MDERELIARSQDGDLDSFNGLVEIYQGQVYNLALRMLGSVASVEDASQEAFIAAFRHVKGFRGGSFRAWLLRIATNSCYDQMRSGKRRQSLSLDRMLEEDPTWEPASGGESPEAYAVRAELARELTQALENPCCQNSGRCWSFLTSRGFRTRRSQRRRRAPWGPSSPGSAGLAPICGPTSPNMGNFCQPATV